ncbi:MAG: hypothetical protein ABJA02_08680 [Acidobacteriota bacterium]
MADDLSITEDRLTTLLNWLDPEPERAGEKYEIVRSRLIRMFANRGCHEPELLTDMTIDRVTTKVAHLTASVDGNHINYFYRVAQFIHKEWLRGQRIKGREVPITDLTVDTIGSSRHDDDSDLQFACLETCLAKLLPDDRFMIVEYYRMQGAAKADNRRSIAEKLNISVGTLHTRANRIRERLGACVLDCTKENAN